MLLLNLAKKPYKKSQLRELQSPQFCSLSIFVSISYRRSELHVNRSRDGI